MENPEVQALAELLREAFRALNARQEAATFPTLVGEYLHARGVRVAPSPTEDAGRWSRGGWHDGPCWREWINNPEGGCTCGR